MDVLKVLVNEIPIEAAEVMETLKEGPYAMKEDPPHLARIRPGGLRDAGVDVELGRIERHSFYDAAGTPDVCLTIATGEQRIYANLLPLRCAVMRPEVKTYHGRTLHPSCHPWQLQQSTPYCRPFVLHSTCTYQTDPSTAVERAAWFAAHGQGIL